MARPGFMVYFADWQPLEALDDAQFRAVFRAAFAFAQTGEDVSIDDPIARMAWLMLRPRIEADAVKYANKVEKARVAGRISAEQRAGNVASDKESTSTVVDGCQRTLTDANGCQHFQPTQSRSTNHEAPTQLNENANLHGFTPPTLEEVKVFAAENGYSEAELPVERFINCYQAKGWRIGNSPMVDWQAKAREWVSRYREEHPDQAPRNYDAPDDESIFW